MSQATEEFKKLLQDLAAGSQYPQAFADDEVDADFNVSK